MKHKWETSSPEAQGGICHSAHVKHLPELIILSNVLNKETGWEPRIKSLSTNHNPSHFLTFSKEIRNGAWAQQQGYRCLFPLTYPSLLCLCCVMVHTVLALVIPQTLTRTEDHQNSFRLSKYLSGYNHSLLRLFLKPSSMPLPGKLHISLKHCYPLTQLPLASCSFPSLLTLCSPNSLAFDFCPRLNTWPV